MDHDHLKDRLLLPSSRAAAATANGPHRRRAAPAPAGGGAGAGAGGVSIDVNGLKRRGGGRRSWVRVDAATGAAEAVEVAKPALMRRLDLPARDLRLLDPLFVYPSAILGRERAVVCNLERVRCIITADEALVLREQDAEEAVRRYVDELQRRLVDRADDLPFEFIALEVALEAACSFLDSQVPYHQWRTFVRVSSFVFLLMALVHLMVCAYCAVSLTDFVLSVYARIELMTGLLPTLILCIW